MQADFIGTCCLDQVYVTPKYPAENKKIRAVKSYSQSGGFATNAAKTYAMLGGQANLHTMIGQSTVAKEIHDNLKIENLSVIDYADAIFKVHSSSIVINDHNNSRTVISSEKDTAHDTLGHPVNISGDVVFIDGFFIESAIEVIKYAKIQNIPIVFDADKWRDDRYIDFLSDVDYVIASDEFYPPNGHSTEDVISFFKNQNIPYFAITNGAEGIIYSEGTEIKTMSVPQIECVDSLGAGDVLHGAFCYFILHHDFQTALEKASKVASHFCTDYGFSALKSLDDIAIFGA